MQADEAVPGGAGGAQEEWPLPATSSSAASRRAQHHSPCLRQIRYDSNPNQAGFTPESELGGAQWVLGYADRAASLQERAGADCRVNVGGAILVRQADPGSKQPSMQIKPVLIAHRR